MNSLERVTAAVGFGKPDRVPVIAQILGHAAKVAGIPLVNYIRNGETLAACQLKALERYKYDAVFAATDTSVETEAVGSVLTYKDEAYPFVKQFILKDKNGIENLNLPDPYKDGRMPELIKAAGILRREVADEVLVAGVVMGPMTVSSQLIGMEKALFMAMDHPESFERLLDFSADVSIKFGLAQIEAGAHLALVFDPSASPAVIPPQFFREFILSRHTRVFSELKQGGSAANWLHIAGPVDDILSYYPEAGVDIANFDYCVDPSTALEKLPKTCLDGNIKPLSFVDAASREIAAESDRLLELFGSGEGFILSSGCEIPPESKQENVAAMVSAVRRGGA